jgi:HK97 family phage major capsid protein
MAATPLVEQRQEFAAKQRELAEVMELAKDGKIFDLSRKSVLEKLGAVDAADALSKVKARNVELDDLGESLRQAELKEVQAAIGARNEERSEPLRGGDTAHPVDSDRPKTLGDLFVQTKQYREAYREHKLIGQPAMIDMSVKTLFQRTAGLQPENVRSGLVVPAVNFSMAEILDLVPIFNISQGAFKYMEETTRTHAATEAAEGTAYPESTFAYAEKSSDVQKIADSIPVTDEQLEDEDSVASLLNQRLTYGVKRRLGSQILNGSGLSPNLRGVLNVVGIQTQAKGTDSIMAAGYKAITKVRFTGQAEPNAFVFHPNDWQEVVLAQEASGNFLWGHPSMGPITSLWGLRVALSTGIAENTALIGDWTNFSRLDEKRGVEVQVGYVGAQFTEGKKTLRADMRAAFTVTRPTAFCSITGI